jgi:glucosamine kinase
MSVCVGIDGGGTRARAVALDEEGRELARSIGPAGIVDAREPATAARAAAELTRAVMAAAGTPPPAAALCCGLAGAGQPAERQAVHAALLTQNVAHRVLVTGDAEAATADAFGDGAGVLLIAGTGSVAWACVPGRQPVRVGGWGRLLGDEGSGYAIGLAALRGVLHALDGRSRPTSLGTAISDTLQIDDPAALVAWAARAAKADIAALAPLVLQAADRGDAAAQRVRSHALRELTRLARTAARRARLRPPDVALSGGLIDPGGPLRAPLEALLQAHPLRATILPRQVDAARGAARLALQLAH